MKCILEIALLILVGVMIWAFMSNSMGNKELSFEELSTRVSKCNPIWANYNEDLKGQIGSTPVARWKGKPVRASIEENKAIIVFAIEGYWADLDVFLPILAREPLGDIAEAHQIRRSGNEVEYIFRLKPEVEISGGAWLEIQYPSHNTKRIVFDPTGNWTE